jgi:hypothetical protein
MGTYQWAEVWRGTREIVKRISTGRKKDQGYCSGARLWQGEGAIILFN